MNTLLYIYDFIVLTVMFIWSGSYGCLHFAGQGTASTTWVTRMRLRIRTSRKSCVFSDCWSNNVPSTRKLTCTCTCGCGWHVIHYTCFFTTICLLLISTVFIRYYEKGSLSPKLCKYYSSSRDLQIETVWGVKDKDRCTLTWLDFHWYWVVDKNRRTGVFIHKIGAEWEKYILTTIQKWKSWDHIFSNKYLSSCQE